MESEKDLFEESGPVHLTPVNWTCPDHCRSVAASLVRGTYVLEFDRQENRHGMDVRAPTWWKFFHFELVEQLIDSEDSSIFGAIYQFTSQNPCPNTPNFIIAFRGTIIRPLSMMVDLKLDRSIIRLSLQQTPRFKTAMLAVEKLVSGANNTKIWLAGHSLGSAIAMLVGKNMVKTGVYLETFLFNPPYTDVPIVTIPSEKIKHELRRAHSRITARLANAMEGQREKSEEYFKVLSAWVPNLFVNKSDPISSEYVGYFEHRSKMEEIGDGEVGKLATQNSFRDLLFTCIGKETEPLHILPSANLTVNSNPSDLLPAHDIDQWWRFDLDFKFKKYLFD